MYCSNCDSLQFCANNPHFCKSYCNMKSGVVFFGQKEVSDVEGKKRLLAEVARKAAEKVLRRDANSTTCFRIYQPKAPAELERFKNIK